MVAAKQSKVHKLLLEHAIAGVEIHYDGQARIPSQAHKKEVDASYKAGYEDASSQYKQQILEFRSEVNALREGTFSELESKFGKIVGEAREAIMTLTYGCLRQVLGGYEMEPKAVESIVEAAVKEAGVDEEKLQVHLHPDDLALLEELDGDLKDRHPGLELVPDRLLKRGDCQLSSRFGKVDGLIENKLERLREGLKPS